MSVRKPVKEKSPIISGRSRLFSALMDSVPMPSLAHYGLSTKCRQQFLDSVDRLIDEPVEVLVGNHLGNNDALNKVRRRQENPDGPNPFVDPSEWKRFLTARAELVRKLMIEDPVVPMCR